MYISQINFNNYSKPNNSHARQVSNPCSQNGLAVVNSANIAFCHRNFVNLHEEAMKLVDNYRKSFERDMKFFVQGGDSILQFSDIPVKTLYNIAKTELCKMQKFLDKHTLYIVTGRIGGGKTSFVKQNNLEEFFYSPDADLIKPLLPGYKDKGAGYVHLASCGINNANFSMALKKA